MEERILAEEKIQHQKNIPTNRVNDLAASYFGAKMAILAPFVRRFDNLFQHASQYSFMLCHIPEIFNETTTNKFTNYIEYATNVRVCATLKRAFEG